MEGEEEMGLGKDERRECRDLVKMSSSMPACGTCRAVPLGTAAVLWALSGPDGWARKYLLQRGRRLVCISYYLKVGEILLFNAWVCISCVLGNSRSSVL